MGCFIGGPNPPAATGGTDNPHDGHGPGLSVPSAKRMVRLSEGTTHPLPRTVLTTGAIPMKPPDGIPRYNEEMETHPSQHDKSAPERVLIVEDEDGARAGLAAVVES